MLSNGRPRLLADPDNPEGSSKVVYAVGYEQYFNFSYTAVGGDDFAEHLSLTAKQDGTSLIEMIRHHAASGGIMIFTVHPGGRLDIEFSSAAAPFAR
ncbi:hypothetical protein ACIO52_02985 [Nocardia sp. NPDC087230]|uniref:hypothetical protein n=1 Tax=Nocardia sp. NPDC087230 TaxID=3364331 RepID=UPI0038099036